MPLNEKSMVAWVGLRGAVPIVLATFPLLAHIPQAMTLFNIVFFIVLTSVLLQGTTLTLVARWLRVREALPATTAYPIAYTPTGQGKNGMVEVEVEAGSAAAGQRIVDLRLPPEALLILVHRGGEFLIPKGATQLLAGDSVLVLATGDALRAVRERLAAA
jgi:cell volume regulation protein A